MNLDLIGIATEAQDAESPDTALVRDARGRVVDAATGEFIAAPHEAEETEDE